MGTSGGIHSWVVHQHILQSFKNVLLSKTLDQNMPDNALFFEKLFTQQLPLSPVVRDSLVFNYCQEK